MRIRNNQKRILISIGLAILATIAAWQFYLFAAFKNTDGAVDLQGGPIHLWVAIIVGLITCVGASFLISSFRQYDWQNELHITTQGRS